LTPQPATCAGLLSGGDDVTTNTNTGTISSYVTAKDQHVYSTTDQWGDASNYIKADGNHNDVKENEDWKATSVKIGDSYATGVQSIKTGDAYTKVYAPPKYTKPTTKGSKAHKSGKRGEWLGVLSPAADLRPGTCGEGAYGPPRAVRVAEPPSYNKSGHTHWRVPGASPPCWQQPRSVGSRHA
jgi:hypothetical protein